MATGYFTNGICYSSYSQAEDSFFQSKPFFIENGIKYEYAKSPTGWALLTSNLSTGSNQYNTNQPLFHTFSTCNLPNDPETQFFNGMELGWAVSGAVIVAFVLRRLRRGF